MSTDAAGAPTHLRCEYFGNPLGLDESRPRLSWRVNDPRAGARQTAYQVDVASSPELLRSDRPDLWASGRVESDQSAHVEYAGAPLRSRQRAFWRVRTWTSTSSVESDQSGVASAWSESAWWEMGLLERRDWTAQWIAAPIVGGPYTIPPAPYLRRGFSITSPVARARLYVTALGIYEFEINGSGVGDAVFAPGRTEYTKCVPYDVYDVTCLLRAGENACGAILGDGWYCGHLHSDPRQTYGDRPRLLAQLEVTFPDGTSQTVATDATWRASEGPIRSSDMLMGEDYDARMDMPGWSAPGFDESLWRDVVVMPDPGIQLVARRAPHVRRTQEVKPVGPPVTSANRRRHIFDLGQNIVGRVRLNARGPRGMVVDLRHAEMLDAEGRLYTQALRTARATDHYTLRGDGADDTFEPRFTFHGFRYIEVRDYRGKPTADDVTGVVVHSDMQRTGEFECSDEMINQLQRNIVWSQRGNFIDIPTDCPQRDERAGWTGDAQVFIRTAAFNYDVANFFTKWLADMADAQGPNGEIPSVVPHVKSFYHEGGPAWADAAVICPWTIYQCYGDRRILAQCWPMMTRFMSFLRERSVNFIRADEHWKFKGYGDWLSNDAETPPEFIGTAFFAYCASLMVKIATVRGDERAASEYARLFEQVRAAFNDRFVDRDGTLKVTTQTALVLGLHFDLLGAQHRQAAVDALVADISSRGMHLSTGFVGTPYLNHVLTRFGRTDVAYALLMQKTFPSWLYPITQGATTMWERWDAWTHEKGFNDTGMNSFNHYAFGAIGEWLYSTVAGIDTDPALPGYKHILIRPHTGGGLTWARGALETMYGRVESSWRIDGGQFRLDVMIPPNTTATVRLPGEAAGRDVGAGRHAFTAALSP